MKVTITLKLSPDAAQSQALADTILAVNLAANFAAQVGFAEGAFTQVSIHHLCYYAIRERYDLPANHAVRAIAKAVAVFARDRTICPAFNLQGAIQFDTRLYRVKGVEVGLTTLVGRISIPFICPDNFKRYLSRKMGEADLISRDGMFFLAITVDVAEPEPIKPAACLGVDLGLVNIATTSEGQTFSGEQVEVNRRRRTRARRTYQGTNTRNSKRRLKKMAKKQSRFQRHTNHVISKQIVNRAKALQASIALEDLTGIRARLEKTVNKPMKKRLGNWAFAHLRHCITYKAALNGLPVRLKNPRNTSRTCSQCGHCIKNNRKSQAVFLCVQCGFSCNADHNAAMNLAV